MRYQKAKIENGKMTTAEITPDTLRNGCFLVQFQGLTSCKDCPYKGTPECEGGEVLKRLQAEK